MISPDHISADHPYGFPVLVADRMLLLAAVSIFANLRSSSTLFSTTLIIFLQALFVIVYNGAKLGKMKRKVTRRQITASGILAAAMIVQLATLFSSVASLGTLQTTLIYFFFELLLEITPLFDTVQKFFLATRLSPTTSGRRKASRSRRQIAAIFICLSFLVTCLFTRASISETALSKDLSPEANTPKTQSNLPQFGTLFANIQAVFYVCIASAIGYISRGFMSGGIRATGFSSLRRAYDIYVCVAFILLIPVNLSSALLNRSNNDPREFRSTWLLLYPSASIIWLLYNSPSRERQAASRSFVAFVTILIGDFLFRVISGRESVFTLTELAVALLSGASIATLRLAHGMTVRLDSLFGPNELRSIFRHVMERQTTRKIFIFLCLNFGFTFVEFLYGYWTNSIGLISDAVHMLFDCTALAIGLYASYVSRLNANDEFPFGYGRFEVLSGFVNGLFLVFISFSVFVESVERLFNPPDIKGSEILVVAVLGLFVNIIGLIFFREAHSHSHGSDGCHNHNSNMQGIFLHVLADALGSVGVIVSSLLVHFFNLTIADPICSLIIAVLILSSVVGLLKETSTILLLRSPPDIDRTVPKVLNKILSMDGVIGVRDFNIWAFRSDQRICSICVHIDSNSVGQVILSDIKDILRKLGMQQISVQIERDEFVSRLEPEVRTRYRRVESTLPGSLDDGLMSDLHSHSHSHGCHGHGPSDHGHSHH